MISPLRPSPARRWRSVTFGLGLVLTLASASPLRAQREDPPRSAWLDLRPVLPGAAAQSVPAWVEAVEFLPPIPGDVRAAGEFPPATFRLRVHRPDGVNPKDDLLVRLFFREGPGGEDRPRVTAWDELGHRLLDSGPLGEGLAGGLGNSESLTVPMAGVNYLEINASDEAAVRGAQLQWLQRREVNEPADVPNAGAAEPERARELRMVANAGQRSADPYRYGTLTAGLQPGVVSVTGGGSGSQQPGGVLLDFELERAPLATALTFDILSDAPVDAPPVVFLNGRAVGAANLNLPDLDDPGYQGEATSVTSAANITSGGQTPGTLSFHYTGWLRARVLLPASALQTGVNRLLIQLSNDTATGAVRAVELQLKYPWEKLDYVLPATVNPPTTR